MPQGILAFGDSITNGGGELQRGVALQSWAQWTARGLGLPYSGYAIDGAFAQDVLEIEIPRFARADRGATYDVGCLYIGVNDVRAFDWDVAAFEGAHRTALEVVAARSERTLTATIPLGLGLPPAGPKVDEANAAIERNAATLGALVMDLCGFAGRRLLMADQVHPTAFGQIAIACKALEVLAANGMEVRENPWDLVSWEEDAAGRLRGDATYVYRRAKEAARLLLSRP